MEQIENYKTTSNKKEIIIMVFKELIKDPDNNLISNEIKEVLEPIVFNEIILGGIIDMVCLASKGEIHINKIKSKCFCI